MTEKTARPRRVRKPKVEPTLDAAELEREAAALFEQEPAKPEPAMTAADLLSERKALQEEREQLVTSLRAIDAQRATLLDSLKAHDGAIEIVTRLVDKLTAPAVEDTAREAA